MSDEDRRKWDARYADGGRAPRTQIGPPPVFADQEHLIPTEGTALELACGRGRAGVWLASRGLDYFGVDVSPVATELARSFARASGVADRCRFEVHDLDNGLPDGPQVDLLFIYLFRDSRLDSAVTNRLAPGGILATACLSEVDAGSGQFRAKPGELMRAFGSLELLTEGEADGMAWLIGRKPGSQ
jgi:hypothetical protein